LWYVVPIAAFVSRKNLRFYPHGGRKARYEKYREAWCLMATPTAEAKDPKQKAIKIQVRNPKQTTAKTNDAKTKAANAKDTRRKDARRKGNRNYVASTKSLASCRAADHSVRCAICPLRK